MPYIPKKDRTYFKPALDAIPEFKNKGELEYVVFALMKKYMKKREYRYSVLHDVTYAIQHVSDEFRRRYLDKREGQARKSNGDI